MGTLADDTAVIAVDGGFSANLSRSWEIWGPNGGYIASIALRAAGKVAPPDHRPATFTCQYLATAQFAAVDIAVEAVRQGRSVWCLNVTLSQGGKRVLQAQVLTTNKSDGPEKIDRRMPDVPKPDALKPIESYLPPDAKPHTFWQNFDAKPVKFIGWDDFEPRGSMLEHWYRYRGFEATSDVYLDYARALLLIDTLQWPSWHRGLKEKPDYAAPSLDVAVWFHTPPGQSDWLLAYARADAATGGLIHGAVEIWTEDGRLIATGGGNSLHVPRA